MSVDGSWFSCRRAGENFFINFGFYDRFLHRNPFQISSLDMASLEITNENR